MGNAGNREDSWKRCKVLLSRVREDLGMEIASRELLNYLKAGLSLEEKLVSRNYRPGASAFEMAIRD